MSSHRTRTLFTTTEKNTEFWAKHRKFYQSGVSLQHKETQIPQERKNKRNMICLLNIHKNNFCLKNKYYLCEVNRRYIKFSRSI